MIGGKDDVDHNMIVLKIIIITNLIFDNDEEDNQYHQFDVNVDDKYDDDDRW